MIVKYFSILIFSCLPKGGKNEKMKASQRSHVLKKLESISL